MDELMLVPLHSVVQIEGKVKPKLAAKPSNRQVSRRLLLAVLVKESRGVFTDETQLGGALCR
jgi:hypothetical protein